MLTFRHIQQIKHNKLTTNIYFRSFCFQFSETWHIMENKGVLFWTVPLKSLEMTFVVIWHYMNKTELNWSGS